MRFTLAEIEQMDRESLMALSGTERFAIGCAMTDAARKSIRDSIEGDPKTVEFKRRYYLRIYGEPAPF
jgi:hypothetical protein